MAASRSISCTLGKRANRANPTPRCRWFQWPASHPGSAGDAAVLEVDRWNQHQRRTGMPCVRRCRLRWSRSTRRNGRSTRQRRVRAAAVNTSTKWVEAAGAARRNHRNIHASDTAALSSQSNPMRGAVPVHRGQENLARPAPTAASRAHSTASRAASDWPLLRTPRTARRVASRQWHDDCLAAVAGASVEMSDGRAATAVLRLTLSAPASITAAASASERMPPRRQRQENLPATARRSGRASGGLQSSRDVEHHDLVNPLDL